MNPAITTLAGVSWLGDHPSDDCMIVCLLKNFSYYLSNQWSSQKRIWYSRSQNFRVCDADPAIEVAIVGWPQSDGRERRNDGRGASHDESDTSLWRMKPRTIVGVMVAVQSRYLGLYRKQYCRRWPNAGREYLGSWARRARRHTEWNML
jgi:hypothetical protein